MDKDQPLVSVIIPTYKRPDNLLRAIQSVRDQTYKNIEIIVVDDNGKGTEWQKATKKELSELIAQKVITYIPHDVNRNGSAARNTGFIASHGEYINFLDDDDVFMPEKIELQLTKLQKFPEEYGACYCNTRSRRKQNITGKLIVTYSHNSLEGNICKEFLLGECGFNISSILFRRKAIEQIHGFDESFKRHQDVELMIRFFRYYKILCTSKDPLMLYDMTSKGRPAFIYNEDYALKKKFLSTFENDIDKTGAANEINFKYWFSCVINQLYSCQYSNARKAIKQAKKSKVFTLHNYISIIKCFFVGQVSKIFR
jgi:glycosyltransferase involved in cell wall biosynthesis